MGPVNGGRAHLGALLLFAFVLVLLSGPLLFVILAQFRHCIKEGGARETTRVTDLDVLVLVALRVLLLIQHLGLLNLFSRALRHSLAGRDKCNVGWCVH